MLLADEINRAPAKTKSALLEAMEELQVTVDGRCHPVPSPFLLIATQDSRVQHGANPLAESQLDRFAVRIVPGYPPADVERCLWMGENGGERLAELAPLIDTNALAGLGEQVDEVVVSDALLAYLEAIVQHTRRRGPLRCAWSRSPSEAASRPAC